MRPRDHLIVLVIVAFTSLAVVLAGRRRGMRGLAVAVLSTVEIVGATTIFFVVNLAIGAVLVLTVRQLTPYYPSLYEVADVALLILSLLQALIFETWRRLPPRGRATRF